MLCPVAVYCAVPYVTFEPVAQCAVGVLEVNKLVPMLAVVFWQTAVENMTMTGSLQVLPVPSQSSVLFVCVSVLEAVLYVVVSTESVPSPPLVLTKPFDVSDPSFLLVSDSVPASVASVPLVG